MKTGDPLPQLERTIELVDMIAYAGATWDWHRLHYDQAFVAEKGLPGAVVDGQMLGALMAEQIMDALGPKAFITNLGFRFKAMVFAGDTVRIEGTVTEAMNGSLAVQQRVTVGDKVAAEVSAKVRV